MKIVSYIIFLAGILLIFSCSNEDPEITAYVNSIEDRREITDEWMANDPNSPFNYKGEIDFHGLNYFEVDPGFIFRSKIYEYPVKDTIIILGTKGEERKASRIGYLKIIKDSSEYRLNVYENYGQQGSVYHSIWFTDRTTNSETYGVGRYLPFELNDDKDHIYEIDFNIAFNPYCAYNTDYSCAIPTKEDFIDLAIYAGEKKYHD